MRQGALKRRHFSAGMAAAVLTGPMYAQVPEGGNIVLGQSAVLSGEWGWTGKELAAGSRLAFEQANNNVNAGLGRRKIELHTLDDAYNPERSAENTRRFISGDMFALYGYTGTATSLAALELATAARMPFIGHFSGAREMRQPFNRMAFHLRASYDDEVEVMVRQLVHLGMTRLAVIHRGDAFGQTVMTGLTASLAKHNLELVAEGVQASGDNDKVEAVMKTVLAGKPHAIIQANTALACAALVRTARSQGYRGTFYHLSIVGTAALAGALQKEAEGIRVSQVVPSPYKKNHPLTRDFLDAIAQHGYGAVKPTYLALEGYLSARVLVEGLRRTHAQSGGKLTRDALVQGMESLKQHVGDVPISYSSSNHQGSRFVEMSMLTKDGRVRV